LFVCLSACVMQMKMKPAPRRASVCAEHYGCVHIRAYFSGRASPFDAAKLSR